MMLFSSNSPACGFDQNQATAIASDTEMEVGHLTGVEPCSEGLPSPHWAGQLPATRKLGNQSASNS
jgi:hypothetical protein